jgi:iron complex outermembrane recepter protein
MRQLFRVSAAAGAMSLLCYGVHAQDVFPDDSGAPSQEPVQEPVQAIEPAPADTTSAPSESLDTIPVDPALQEPAVAASPSVNNRLVEEIVVTAQKREENTQDVPISIQAFSSESLSARNCCRAFKVDQEIEVLRAEN